MPETEDRIPPLKTVYADPQIVIGAVASPRAAPGVGELIASCDHEIVGMAIHKDRLIVATRKGVFERGDDGVFHELRFNDDPTPVVPVNDWVAKASQFFDPSSLW